MLLYLNPQQIHIFGLPVIFHFSFIETAYCTGICIVYFIFQLIQFLVSLVSSNRTGLTIPAIRRVPLAINDVSQLAKQESASEQTYNKQDLKDASVSVYWQRVFHKCCFMAKTTYICTNHYKITL